MSSPPQSTIFFLFTAVLLVHTPFSATARTIGVVYNPTYHGIPPPSEVVKMLKTLEIRAVRMNDVSSSAVGAFAGTDIALTLVIPNSFVSLLARNESAAQYWIQEVILGNPRTLITTISVGEDFTASPSGQFIEDASVELIQAMRNLRFRLEEYALTTIQVSSTFSFKNILQFYRLPSKADFITHEYKTVLDPTLEFLSESNSSFLVNVHPFFLHKKFPQIPINDYILFNGTSFVDTKSHAHYSNIIEMMIECLLQSLSKHGYKNLSIVVTTGWPRHGVADASDKNVDTYVEGLVQYFSYDSTILIKEELKFSMDNIITGAGKIVDVFLHELYNDQSGRGLEWGITLGSRLRVNLSFISPSTPTLDSGREDSAISWWPGGGVVFIMACVALTVAVTCYVTAYCNLYLIQIG